MDSSLDRTTKARRHELSGAWQFLPYDEGEEIPRREVQVLRVLRAAFVPLVDTFSLLIAVTGAYLITVSLASNGDLSALGSNTGNAGAAMFWAGLAAIPLWLLLFHYYGVYKRQARRLSVSTFDELPQTVGIISLGTWLMFSFLVITGMGGRPAGIGWMYAALTWLLLIVVLPVLRAVARISLSFYNPFRTSTLVVGAGEIGKSLVGRLSRHKEYGLRVVGFLDTKEFDEDERSGSQVKLLGRPSELRGIADRYGISRVIIAFSRTPHPLMLGIIHECQEMKVDVSVVPRFFEALSHRVEMEDIEGLSILSLPRYTHHGLFARMSKRLIDLVGASLALIIFSPLFLLVGILIKIDSRGPVFYSHERMGKNHKKFRMIKFRSMREDADSEKEDLVDKNEMAGPIFKIKDDPRMTRVGRVIRRWSIDELPQIINVFRGEMSLVGPRPLVIEEANQLLGAADMRHLVQPGITGLWQILGRSDVPFQEMLQLDYLYVTNWSVSWDIKIMLRTAIAIMRKRGAY